ncbi:hypothetical protein B0A58_10710 [Flavobacterium branchiophilum NBRC 15030 = ATCC 35035]|uniref:DUF4296 domain-containing protein n=2 Tax=Flavobacterium branchiophilum TaxID=55197 RepID=A0A2H3KMB6_9FLAO|nr:DUF4296 domain-containing protein [Flavobacterium branchiophilum]OXA74557.1 hypothetical protein B0A58_10710 [Flavobacterium branchiophilum NBRC 15030 = ATCC 35035]PDS24516.1 DUF4296 domain-containing protein [Flavobacterium branchiophilum]TQM41177.1 uncharacterized protein DUF4296 [Flavobacterium branchiophilum]CCB68783.1 Probable lipoprotein precursor [Flavobacterium branchiophilum FL-15]GEM55820.1 lipoprotein precursor [Flavobacterium branchiophilum NBRC 15030 = ATCC 35035]
MKKALIVLIVFGFLLSCKETVVEKPKNLIDDDVMVEILYDLALLDAVRNNTVYASKLKTTTNKLIYEKYKIDSVQFAKSHQYYASNIAKYRRMYNKVNAKLAEKDSLLTYKILKK